MTDKLVRRARRGHIHRMSNVSNIAVSSIRAAGARFAAHAANIANLNSPGYVALRPEQISTAYGPVVRISKPGKSRPEAQKQGDVDLAREFLGVIASKYDHKAAVILLRTEQELSGSLLDTLA